MRKLPFILSYLILVSLWCVAFYQFIAPIKGPALILRLSVGSLFYSLIWALFISLFQRMIGWKGYGMLFIPLGIMFVFFLGIEKSDFLFLGGLMIISELVSLAKISSYNRKKGK